GDNRFIEYSHHARNLSQWPGPAIGDTPNQPAVRGLATPSEEPCDSSPSASRPASAPPSATTTITSTCTPPTLPFRQASASCWPPATRCCATPPAPASGLTPSVCRSPKPGWLHRFPTRRRSSALA